MDTRLLRNPPVMSMVTNRDDLYKIMAERMEKAAGEIDTLRAALFAIEVYLSSAETYDPNIEDICRTALAGDQ